MGEVKLGKAPIDESVGLLNKLNKTALEGLRKKHPEFISILEEGIIAGKDEISKTELELRIEVCQLALYETLKATKDKYLPLLHTKLKKLQRIELWSQIIIVISSSTIFVLLEKGFKYAAYIAAFLSLASAILTIILKQNSGEWAMNNFNIASSFNSLVNHRIKSEEILRELTVLSKHVENNKEKEIANLIKAGNEVNREIRQIIDKIG